MIGRSSNNCQKIPRDSLYTASWIAECFDVLGDERVQFSLKCCHKAVNSRSEETTTYAAFQSRTSTQRTRDDVNGDPLSNPRKRLRLNVSSLIVKLKLILVPRTRQQSEASQSSTKQTTNLALSTDTTSSSSLENPAIQSNSQNTFKQMYNYTA